MPCSQVDDTSMGDPVPLVNCHNGNIGRKYGGLVIVLLSLASCGAAPVAQGINDPFESANRGVHSFNLAADTYAVRPVAKVYGAVLPNPVKTSVNNFANNLDGPGDVLNNILQGRVGNAGQNTLRFVVNTTMGVGGLFDAATAIGIPEAHTDFGETLHVWGASEGAYVELPLLGPSTVRDATGRVVDTLINPTRFVLEQPVSTYATAANIGSKLSDRSRFMDTFDALLYESADGYAQARLLYLEKRRFRLGQTTEETTFEDPYEDPYAK
jgi:phospholipid-binding lipoprotein MlaA